MARMAVRAPDDYAGLQKTAEALPHADGRLFRVTREGVPTSFLFGTLHVVDPRLSQLSAATMGALRSSTALALETLEFGRRLPKSLLEAELVPPEDQRASRLLAPAQFRRMRALLARRGFPPDLADRVKAPALALMLDLPTCATARTGSATFLDDRVLGAAREMKLKAVGLETTPEQLAIADDLPASQKTALLDGILAQSDDAESVTATSVSLFLQGRIGLLLAWTRFPRPIAGVAAAGIPPAFVDRIVTARSARMRDRLLPLLRRGGVFIAVGATHIPGADGLASLLENAGYGIERIE